MRCIKSDMLFAIMCGAGEYVPQLCLDEENHAGIPMVQPPRLVFDLLTLPLSIDEGEIDQEQATKLAIHVPRCPCSLLKECRGRLPSKTDVSDPLVHVPKAHDLGFHCLLDDD